MNDNQISPDTRANIAQAERDAAQLQRDAARTQATIEHVRRDEAEQERNLAMNVAAEQAVERDAATTTATLESQRRLQAENQAISARVAANQSQWAASNLATERNVLRENLAVERADASNSKFGFVLLTCIILAGLIALGIWYFTSQPVVSSGSTTIISTPSGPSQPNYTPPAPAPTASNPIVIPPSNPPNVNINVTPPASSGSSSSGVVTPVTPNNAGTPNSGSDNGASGGSNGNNNNGNPEGSSDPPKSGSTDNEGK